MKRFTLLGFLNLFTPKDLLFESSGESSFKMNFSKDSLKEKVYSNHSRNSITSLFMLLILFLFSNFLSAQIITVDGSTSDWSNNLSVKHVQDAFGNGVVDDQFTEGSKDFLFANDLAWVIGQTKAKNDIANGGFGLANQVNYVDANNVTQTLNGSYLVFAGDRTSNNGDAQIGFWFYLNNTAPVEVNGSRYFAPAHARGDLLVLADFTGGGRLGTVKVYRWIGGGSTSIGSTIVPNTNGNLETTSIASIVAENNAGTPNVPSGWNFTSPQYATNEFYEGFVDLGNIGGNTNFTCSATVLLETRSSQSVTASLDDFIGSTLGEVPKVTVNSQNICLGQATSLTATPSPAGTYTYSWTGPNGFTSSSPTITNLTTAGTYSVIVTNQAGCPSSPGAGTVTNYPVTPNNTASGMVCVGSKFNYEGTEYLPGSYDIPRTDANGCSWKTVLTVSNYPTTPNNTANGMVCVGSKFNYEGTDYLPGSYDIPRMDSNGCSWKTVLTVSNYPTTPNNTANGMVCVGSKFNYEGTDYLPGSYDIPRTDANGCSWKTVLTVSNYPVTANNTTSGMICIGSKYTYEGKEYAPGTYNIPRTDSNGCSFTTTLTVTEFAPIVVTADPQSVCIDNKVVLTGSPAGGTWTGNNVSGNIFDATGLAAGSYNVTYTVQNSNGCSNKACATITVNNCNALCTYTQGYYGNDGGKSCANGVSYTTKGLIAKALTSYGGTMRIGLSGRSVSMSANAIDIAKIIEVLPGGGSSLVLSPGDFTITGMPASYLKNGNINNTLLAQTITLGLNLGIDSNLGNFVLKQGKLATAAPQGGCGSKIPMPRTCSFDLYTPTINEYKYFDIPAVVNLLPTKTVQGLFDMANKALGGGTLPAGVTLTNLANAVDVINNAFDGCRISMGYNQSPLTCEADRAAFNVTPVPIVDNATVTYKFSYVSDVTIQVWSLGGVMLYSQNDTNSYFDKQVLINYSFTTSGTYIIRIFTNIGSSSRTVIKN